ncbi:hypothetical protein PILCRDRAFT_16795 [Piloderma croceum F 1598]|uniref:Uncharacterized protein n=1 Tax=Piloderma croceum (strain F 1598) TaxID=765440 RepID=A0A0C3AD61_PILCF|nr:hypothetical protein PILCRDRAFT_16795 [Piloderma croceum F 1598]
MIDQLRGVTQRLGAEDDLLAQFSGAPFVDPNEYKDPWEMMDKVLNGGRDGMDSLCDWLET